MSFPILIADTFPRRLAKRGSGSQGQERRENLAFAGGESKNDMAGLLIEVGI